MILFWIVISLMTLIGLGFILWPWKSFSVFTAILFFILVGLAWLQWGNQKEVIHWLEVKRNAVAVKDLKEQLGNSPEHVIERLKQQLEKNPKSAKGWFLLGKLYMAQQQYTNAVDVFSKANNLKPNDPEIMLDYAQVLFILQKTKQSALLARQVLAQDPQNPRAINLLASDAFREGQYQEAIQQWEKLRSYYPFDSEDAKALESAIERAKMALGGIKIPIHVELASRLQQKVSPNDVIFIYARDADSSSSMPLLILRKQVRDLPMKIILDESMKMNPANSLKDIRKVIIVARISKTGQAKSQTGDIEGVSRVVELGNIPKDLQISINRVIK
jgi:cytochrome c-type biogenesis protein CcmH